MPIALHISSHLEHYTGGARELSVAGTTLDAALDDLDRQYPGIRFRFITEQREVREHFNIWINKNRVHDLSAKVNDGDVIHVLAALSGG